jgi:UDP-N-acetyl-D-mannosaminuronic acid transferase (WecB/TagA/CpsF family)
MKINILGIEIDRVELDDVIKRVIYWLNTSGKHYIVTPNIEFINLAEKDREFRNLYFP